MQPTQQWMEDAARTALKRLLPRVLAAVDPGENAAEVQRRMERHFPRAFSLLYRLYSDRHDFYWHVQEALEVVIETIGARPPALRELDREREASPQWFQSEQMLGAVCYVDRFAGTLAGVRDQIPYFRELGLTYLHLMPLFRVPEPENDGGYAVSSFREVNPKLGTMAELSVLADDLRAEGISLVCDFVFNHTSDEHGWALRALAGETRYQAYYRMFDDRTIPDQYEPHLREIFPDSAPGSFTFRPEIGKWVWTTFYPFQWDLNYANPEVFNAMLREMLFLANQGIEVLRLDAVPFVWKQLGTNSENLPEAHLIIQAFNALTRIAAPALLFKSEAIVHPRDINSYIGWEECPISYNPTLMVGIWEAVATREVRLLRHSMEVRFEIPEDCAWVNYLRSHDDIGWGFANEDAADVYINGHDHRHFLNTFYTGMFPGSFARGLAFNFNSRTLDMRISGTTASLAGLESALLSGDAAAVDLSVARIAMMYSIVMSAGGIPLIYLGDEIGTVNDTSYEVDPYKRGDNRWAHRPPTDWTRMALRNDRTTVEGRIYEAITRLIWLRKRLPALSGHAAHFFDTGNPHVLGYVRSGQIVCAANFSERKQPVALTLLTAQIGQGELRDLVANHPIAEDEVSFAPYQYRWLVASD